MHDFCGLVGNPHLTAEIIFLLPCQRQLNIARRSRVTWITSRCLAAGKRRAASGGLVAMNGEQPGTGRFWGRETKDFDFESRCRVFSISRLSCHLHSKLVSFLVWGQHSGRLLSAEETLRTGQVLRESSRRFQHPPGGKLQVAASANEPFRLGQGCLIEWV